MARYIDADMLLDKIGTVPLWTGYSPPYSFEVHLALVEIEKQLKGIIKAIPTADVVEVVRCEKCKYGDVSIISMAKDGEEDIACYCTLKKVVTNIDSYCPSGRREDK